MQQCTGCEDGASVQTNSLSECKRCPRRYWDETTHVCSLCPSLEQKASADGLSCVYTECTTDADCAGVDGLPYCVGGKCVKCQALRRNDGTCYACPAVSGRVDYVTKQSCHDGCGGNYFYSSYGKDSSNMRDCTGCESKDVVQATLEECQRCPHRYWNETTHVCMLCPQEQKASADGKSCTYDYCTTDADCAGVDGLPYCVGGKCVKCKYLKVNYAPYKCVACPAVTSSADAVTKQSCHDGCGGNYFYGSGGGVRDSERACIGCGSTSSPQTSTLAECQRCPRRYWNETTHDCKLCPSGKKTTADGLGCE